MHERNSGATLETIAVNLFLILNRTKIFPAKFRLTARNFIQSPGWDQQNFHETLFEAL